METVTNECCLLGLHIPLVPQRVESCSRVCLCKNKGEFVKMNSRLRKLIDYNPNDFDIKYDNEGNKLCLNCGVILGGRKLIFCSSVCRARYVKKKIVFWQDLRLEIFKRDRWRCQDCSRQVSDKPNTNLLDRAECDHIIPIFQNGKALDKNNLQTLCYKCHLKKTCREKRFYANPKQTTNANQTLLLEKER